MQFVGLDEHTRFHREGGEAVTVDPGMYRIDVLEHRKIVLTGEDGTATIVEAESGAHPLKLDAPVAVAFDAKRGDRRLAVLLPGGVAVCRRLRPHGGRRRPSRANFLLSSFRRRNPQEDGPEEVDRRHHL